MSPAVLAAIVVAAVAFETFCLVDLRRARAVRYLPTWAWAGICLISIPLGGILYLAIGKDRWSAPNTIAPRSSPPLGRSGRVRRAARTREQ